jgi:hypothetical protein
MLEKYAYRYINRMYNSDCFSIAKIVKLTFLNMKFTLTLPLLFNYTQLLKKTPFPLSETSRAENSNV